MKPSIEFPCTNCICVAICRSMYLEYKDAEVHPQSDVVALSVIASRCSLISDYIDQDYTYFRRIVVKYYRRMTDPRRIVK